jgi:hypothetical protein
MVFDMDLELLIFLYLERYKHFKNDIEFSKNLFILSILRFGDKNLF